MSANNDPGRLPRPRTIVPLGLLLVVALALAARAFSQRSPNRGEPDDWTRVLHVTTCEHPYVSRAYEAGFTFDATDPSKVIAAGSELLDEPDASPLAAAMAVADERGYGFLLLDLRDNWDLSPLAVEAPPGSIYAAIGIGDVAREGTRVSFGAPVTGPFVYVDATNGRDVIEETAIQLALLEHPDFNALFDEDTEGPRAKRSRRALDQGTGRERRRTLLARQQEAVAKIDAMWPNAEPGELAGRWERVHAVPVPGGVIVEFLPVWLDVASSVAKAGRHSGETGELAFVPTAALAAGADPIAARRVCSGTVSRPEYEDPKQTVSPDLFVSPDGKSLVLVDGHGVAELHRVLLTSPNSCLLGWVESRLVSPLDRLLVSNSSDFAGLTTAEHQLWWRDVLGQHSRLHPEVRSKSVVGWLGDDLLAVLGEDELLLLRANLVSSGVVPRAVINRRELVPKLAADGPAAKVVSVYAIADDTMLVLTEACPASHLLGHDAAGRLCVHRVRVRARTRERIGEAQARDPVQLGRRDLELRTLGPIDAHLAFAARGDRIVYVSLDTDAPDERAGLFSLTIEGRSLGQATRVADVHPRSTLQLSDDGRVVVVEAPLEVPGFNGATTARAFALGP